MDQKKNSDLNLRKMYIICSAEQLMFNWFRLLPSNISPFYYMTRNWIGDC